MVINNRLGPANFFLTDQQAVPVDLPTYPWGKEWWSPGYLPGQRPGIFESGTTEFWLHSLAKR